GRDLSFTNVKRFVSSAWTNTVIGLQKFNLARTNIANATAETNQVLTLLDAATGRSDWQPLPPTPFDVSIYTTNGTLTSDRVVTTGPRLMQFDVDGARFSVFNGESASFGAKTNLQFGSDTLKLSAGSTLGFATPLLSQSQVQVGDVLTISALTPGTEAATDFYTPTNLYTFDGTLTGDRRGELGAKNLTFNGPGSQFQVFNTDYSGFSGLTNVIWGLTNLTIGSPTAFKLKTPGVVSNLVNPGMVLTLTTTDGDAEYRLTPNLYNTNGTLLGHRTVSGSFN